VPLGVQQKQIIVTCNYEARRRGLRKLQLITDAKKQCPDLVIVVGEQLDRFRDASKILYKFLESFTWNNKVERLGLDEVFLDVTDIINYNRALLNPNDLSHAFFHLSRENPTLGFPFDASGPIAGHEFPEGLDQSKLAESYPADSDIELHLRLRLGSHLAQHLRLKLEEEKRYTSTVGISTNKLLAKLVGNCHKPKTQTTLLPPYQASPGGDRPHGNVATFIDSHDIGKIPGIGNKMALKIRNHVFSRPIDFDDGSLYAETKERLTVGELRKFPGMGPELLEKILGGPGSERDVGAKVWGMINGIDNTEVKEARNVPAQISIEDSYMRLDNMAQVRKEMSMLTTSLINRMHIDLLEEDEDNQRKRWIAHPKTIRLSTRPRPPRNADGARSRTFVRITRSCPLPNFVLNVREDVNGIVERLIQETLLPLFLRLHDMNNFDLSLINICVSNMAETASEHASGKGRDIARMFARQEELLKDWKVEDKDVPPDCAKTRVSGEGLTPAEPSAGYDSTVEYRNGSEDTLPMTQSSVDEDMEWEEAGGDCERCCVCSALMPSFAMAAHERYHTLGGR
jgi:DNA polymerase iota